MKPKKFNFDDMEFSKYVRPWNQKLDLKPIVQLVQRLCTLCNKPLPPDRHFNHDECIADGSHDEVFMVEMHQFHRPVARRVSA